MIESITSGHCDPKLGLRMFQVDKGSHLSIFVDGCISRSASSKTSTFERESESKINRGDFNSGSTVIDVVFEMNYVPKHLGKEDIMKKLENFGAIKKLELKMMPDLTSKETGLIKGSNFKQVNFSFEKREVTLVFLKLKRIRIKGLQVKVGIKAFCRKSECADNKLLPDSKQHIMEEDQQTHFIHTYKPTSKTYFSSRPNYDSNARSVNFIWRMKIPMI